MLYNNNPTLQTAILSTITYFDIFEFPLTSIEIYKYLWNHASKKYTINEVMEELNNLCAKNEILTKCGLYYLKGRSDTVTTRLTRYALSFEKIKIAKRIARIFKFIPFIKLIAICNSLSYRNARKESDIDLFIIVQPNRLWLTRLLTAFFLKILNLRPSKRDKTNKICLCFFLSEDNLNIQSIAIPSPDIYLIYWIKNLYPLLDRNEIYTKFLTSNDWIQQYVNEKITNESIRNSKFEIRNSYHVLNLFDQLAKKIQLKIMPSYLKNIANTNTNVIIRDNMLKFHNNDQRARYQKDWLEKLKN